MTEQTFSIRGLLVNRYGLTFLSAIVITAFIILLFSLQAAFAAPSLPTVQTDPADNNFLDRATLHGQITDTGGESCEERGFDWRSHSDSTWQSWTETSGGPYGAGSFSHILTGLDPGSVYAFRAKARNSAGWSYGAVRTFRVIAIGTMVTLPATDITPGSAALNAKIVDDGGYNLSNRAFRYRKLGSETWFNPFESGTFGPLVAFGDGFEDGNPEPFVTKSEAQWAVDAEEFFLGGYSARSGIVADGDMSHLAVELTVANYECTLRFACRVSSEEDSDYLVFNIDGEERARWSGETGWHEFEQSIPTGEHTLEWVFQKDEFGSHGQDAAWVDEVLITSPAYFSMGAVNLEPGTTYECYSYGYNPAGMSNGGTLQFTTTTDPPTVSTGDAGSITYNGATLNGTIVAVNTLTPCDERGFDWRKQGDTEWQSWTESDSYGTGAYSKAITGLEAYANYEVRAKAHNSVDWGYGDVKVFTTDVGPPSVRADPATSITPTSATFNGTIVSTGGLTCDWRGFKYKRQVDTYWLSPDMEEGSFGPGPFSLDISGLVPGATYEFYCYAHNARGFTVSNTLTFDTKAAPTVTTEAVSGISAGSATLNGDITDTGGLVCDERGFDWRRQGDAEWQSWTESPGPYGIGSFSHAITSLSPYDTYEFKAKAHNSAGWSYGGTLTFTTLALPPTVTTDQATEVAEASATLNGSITNIGGQGCDTFTFEWRKSEETSWQSWSQQDFPGFGIGSHSYHIYPLEAGTTYEFRFGAHNSAGWTYGDTLTFTTLHPAIVRTDPATDMTTTSAILNGEILDTGGQNCSNRSFYIRQVGGSEWFSAGWENGSFPAGPYSTTVTGLSAGTDYEFKAKAYTEWTSVPGEGEVLTFRTAVPSAVQTEQATGIATTSADIHGLITETGGENCDQRGFQWRRQGDEDWISWSETGDYPADIRLSDGFEDGTLPPFGTGSLGYSPWIVDSPGAGGSAYCARSAVISDSQKTYIRGFSSKATRVSFNFKVSSEQDYDCLIFKIDDYQEVARWSGEMDWQMVTFDLVPGQHTFDWWYEKDGSVSQGSDCAWIDDVRIETPFDLHISGLDPATTYEFRATAHNSTGWSYSETCTLSTGGTVVVETNAATDVSSDSATLKGDIVDQGAGACNERGFDWRPAGQEGWQPWTETGSFGPGEFQHVVSGLQPGTGYSFRAKAHNAWGWSFGDIVTFETAAAPVMETNAATSVGHQSAVLNGVIASTGGVACEQRGFQWRKQGETEWQSWTEAGSYSTDRLNEISHDFEDGTLGTLSSLDYTFNMVWRADLSDFGANTGAWSARSPVIPDAKIIPENVRSSIMYNEYYVDIPGDNYRIRFARKVSSQQDHDYLAFYMSTETDPPLCLVDSWSGEVPWGTVSYPVIAGDNAFYWYYYKDAGHDNLDAAWVDDVVIESTIPFSHKIEGLEMGTEYEFRSMAQNPVSALSPTPDDYSYGPEQTFTTAEYSVTQTNAAGSVTSVSAVLNGDVTNTGGLDIDERGFEWRRRGDTGGWKSWTESDGPYGTGVFSHRITGLLPNVTHEFRAKARTAAGWSYGDTMTFTTLSESATWYLAEGTTAWGFDTYISIMNPNTSALKANITYMPDGRSNVTETVELPARSQTTLTNDHLVQEMGGNYDFSTRVVSSDLTKPIAVDRTMFWYSGRSAEPEAHSSIGVTSPAKNWYMPEGSTNWGFETWLLIQNPNSSKATCQVTYMIEGGDPVTKTKVVPGNSRETFNMRDDIGNKDASIKVASDIPVIPERSMYRNERSEGHDSIGTTSPSADYFLAEGTTAWGFTTYVMVQNPGSRVADVTVTYMTDSGPSPQPTFQMSPRSRKTIRVNDILPNRDFSTRVHGSVPIIAERSMYWYVDDGGYLTEKCHDSIGMDRPHTCFYLPDGDATDSLGVETWTLVQNPNSSPVTVEITYMTPSGTGNITFADTIPANSRRTYNMKEKIPGSKAATTVRSKSPGMKIMVERAMYWANRSAGTDTIGGCAD